MAQPSPQTAPALHLAAQKATAAIRKGDAKPLKVTGRLREALEAMVFKGLKRADAAEAASMTDHGLRQALRRPHVLAFLNEQMEVLRTSARPRALGRITELVEQKDSLRVALEAAKYLDGMDRPSHTMGAVNVQVNTSVHVESPGYVIDLSAHPRGTQQIDHLPQHEHNRLDDKADVPEDE